jgi:hypothetical protein
MCGQRTGLSLSFTKLFHGLGIGVNWVRGRGRR